MAEIVYRGSIEVQNNWNELFKTSGMTVAVRCRYPNEPVIHGKLKCMTSDGKLKISGQDGFEVNLNDGVLNVSFSNEKIRVETKVLPSSRNFTKIHKSNKIINDLDVTKGGIGASCDGDDNCFIWMTENGDVMRQLLGHKGEVYCCKFHPSDLILVTGSADMSLKMWNARDSSCLATFVGHIRGVTDFALIEEGRKVVSISKDGKAKIWDAVSSRCLSTLDQDEDFLNCCFVAPPKTSDGAASNEKVLFVGTNKGQLIATGLNDGTNVFTYNCESPVLCCSSLSDQLIICGTQDSCVHVIDARSPSEPVICIKESRYSISSILPHKRGCYITTGGGSAYFLNSEFDTTLDLSGPEFGGLSKIVSDNHFLYTGGKEGIVRKYVKKF